MKAKIEATKRAPIYLPLDLLARLQESAVENRRSFTKEVTWRLEQSYAPENQSKVTVGK